MFTVVEPPLALVNTARIQRKEQLAIRIAGPTPEAMAEVALGTSDQFVTVKSVAKFPKLQMSFDI